MSFILDKRTSKRVAPPGGKFSDSELEYNRVFDDDYVHKNHWTFNYNGKGNNFAIKNKATVDILGAAGSKPSIKTSYSTKIITQVNDAALEVKLDNKGTVRLWNDLGTYDVGLPLTVTGKLKTTNAFDKLSWAAQVQSTHGDVSATNRIHGKANGHLFWNSKLQYTRGDITAGLITKLSTSTFLLSKLTVFGVYRLQNNTIFAELANRGNGLKSDPTSQVLTVASTFRFGGNNYGVKLGYDLLNKADPVSIAVGTVAKVNNDTTLRAKIDNKTVLALSAKYVRSSTLNVQVGTAVTLNDSKTFTTNNVIPVPIGFAINLNYA